MSINDIKEYIDKFIIINNIVYFKDNNQQITDEDLILKVKSARLIYNEARFDYQEQIKQFGKVSQNFEYFIKKTMEKFAVNGEVNTYGVNKLINGILNSNGHYEENISGADLKDTKFSILVEPKKSYTIAYLKFKFREKGLDIEDIEITQDTSKLKHDGISKVILNYKIKPYQKSNVNIHDLQGEEKKKYAVEQLKLAKQNGNIEMVNYWQSTIENIDMMQNKVAHPYSETLNELEKQKNEAEVLGDDVGVNYYKSNIVEIIKNHPYELSPEAWDALNDEQRKKFILIKMKEAKILEDVDSFNYWKANLDNLDEKTELKR